MENKVDEYRALHDKVIAQKAKLDMLEKKERIAANFLKSGISFIPAELNRLLATYMTLKEGKLYITKTGWTSFDKEIYCGIIGSEEYKKGQEKHHLYTKGIIEEYGIITFKCERNTSINLKEDLGRKMMTHQFLIDKYDLNNMYTEYERGMITKINFDEHEDIKEFIMYLAELQIENNKHYTYDEMLEILSNYLSQIKNTPKKRTLV